MNITHQRQQLRVGAPAKRFQVSIEDRRRFVPIHSCLWMRELHIRLLMKESSDSSDWNEARLIFIPTLGLRLAIGESHGPPESVGSGRTR